MDGIMTVSELVETLLELPADAPVFIAVVKYPSRFAVREKIGNDGQKELSWMDSDDVEVHPLEEGEVTNQKGIIYLTIELQEDLEDVPSEQ